MKLDRFKFAQLVAWIVMRSKDGLNYYDIEELDSLTEIEMPNIQPAKAVASMNDVNELLMQFKIAKGSGYIPAIKAYRAITGCDLKTAKEAIERYR